MLIMIPTGDIQVFKGYDWRHTHARRAVWALSPSLCDHFFLGRPLDCRIRILSFVQYSDIREP